MLAQRSLRAACRTHAAAAPRPVQWVRPTQRLVARRAQSDQSGVDAEELQKKASEVASQIKDKWEKTEDKGGAVIVAGGTVLALSIAFSVVNAIDKIPVVSDLIELVGVGVTGWFTYRYITVGPDGDELFVSIRNFVKKVYNF